jgi:hypothetical protein
MESPPAPERTRENVGKDQNLCVVVPTRGIFLPKYGVADEQSIHLNWIHYRGFRRSPFLPLPRKLKQVINEWRNYAKFRSKVTEPGREPVKMCYLCGVKVDNCDQHRQSEEHAKRVETIDWATFDKVKGELEAEFSEKHPL